jgi:hypothetical protein
MQSIDNHIIVKRPLMLTSLRMGHRARQGLRLSASRLDLDERMAFLKEDLNNLFNDRGIDASAYEPVVDFKGEFPWPCKTSSTQHL